MLQQTQVARVVPRYDAFVERFPTVAACAGAEPGDVVRMWAGLGYNRRALNLHRAATAVVEKHGGRIPARLADLRALPGIGPYTARAVLAYAFEADIGLALRDIAAIAGWPAEPERARRAVDQLLAEGLALVDGSALRLP